MNKKEQLKAGGFGLKLPKVAKSCFDCKNTKKIISNNNVKKYLKYFVYLQRLFNDRRKKAVHMGSILNEYISKRWGVIEFKEELKRLVEQYNKLTKSNLFIYAADFNKGRRGVEVSLMQDDFYIIQDILRESPHERIDFWFCL